MADVDILIKLFDTLKESNKETSNLCHALLQNQNDISNYIKNLPMEEVKQLLKDHAKESSAEIDSCTETVEEKTNGVMEEIKNLKIKVNRMILVVIVAFTILSGSYVIIRTITEDQTSHKQMIEEVQKMIEEKHEK